MLANYENRKWQAANKNWQAAKSTWTRPPYPSEPTLWTKMAEKIQFSHLLDFDLEFIKKSAFYINTHHYAKKNMTVSPNFAE